MLRFPAIGVLVALLSLATGGPAAAESKVELAPSHQAKLILVGLSFFRNLAPDGEGHLTVLLVGSCPVATALHDMSGKAINGYKLRFIESQERPDDEALLKLIAKNRTAAVFDCAPQEVIVRRTVAVAGGLNMPLLALNAQAVQAGALLGTEVANGRPALVLNVKTARDLGLTFDARLSSVARLVQ